jgi:hypothetical protein
MTAAEISDQETLLAKYYHSSSKPDDSGLQEGYSSAIFYDGSCCEGEDGGCGELLSLSQMPRAAKGCVSLKGNLFAPQHSCIPPLRTDQARHSLDRSERNDKIVVVLG